MTNSPDPALLEKVKKLLALGQSPSEAEASSALAKAQELLARYGLGLEDVAEQAHQVDEQIILDKQRPRAWESYLVWVVARSSFTTALKISHGKASRTLLVGRPENIAVALELFSYLHRVVLVLGRKHSQEVAHLESFKTGLVHRLGERLEQANQNTQSQKDSQGGSYTTTTQTALVLKMEGLSAQENSRYIQEKYGTTSSARVGRRVDADSYHRGRKAGDGVSLAKQLR